MRGVHAPSQDDPVHRSSNITPRLEISGKLSGSHSSRETPSRACAPRHHLRLPPHPLRYPTHNHLVRPPPKPPPHHQHLHPRPTPPPRSHTRPLHPHCSLHRRKSPFAPPAC